MAILVAAAGILFGTSLYGPLAGTVGGLFMGALTVAVFVEAGKEG